MNVRNECKRNLIGKVGNAPQFSITAGGEAVSFPIMTEAISFWTDDEGRSRTKTRAAWFRVVALEPRVVRMIKVVKEGDTVWR